jgi:hypothetical protein
MSSQAQIDANRANAQKATGPKTPEGRAAVRLNGLQHGLRAETAVLPCEDAAEFDSLKQEFESEFQPVGAQECFLFEEIVLAAWRLQRARIYETALSSRLFRTASNHQIRSGASPDDLKALGAMLLEDAEGKKLLDYVSRIEGRYRRTYSKAVRDIRELQEARRAAAQQRAASAAAEAASAASPASQSESALVATATAPATTSGPELALVGNFPPPPHSSGPHRPGHMSASDPKLRAES